MFVATGLSSLSLCMFRERLIKWFVDLQLSDYNVTFHDSEEVGGAAILATTVILSTPLILLQVAWLDKVDRRYAWLKRLLMNISTNCPDIFPASWGIPERIAINFCSQTKFVNLLCIKIWQLFGIIRTLLS